LFKGSDGTEILLANGGTKIKYYDTGSTDWVDLPSLPTIGTSGERFDYIMYQDLVIMASQSEHFSWDGSGAVTDENTGSAISTHAGLGDILMLDGELRRVYMSGDDDNSSTVYVSDTDDYTNYDPATDATSILVYEEDGSKITGMAMVFRNRYVIKENKIVRLEYNADSGVHTPIIVDAIHGAIGKDAWALGENQVFFFTGTEIRAFGEFANLTSEQSFDIGLKIKPSILADMDENYLKTARLEYFSKKIILTYASVDAQTAGVHDKQIILDLNVPAEGNLASSGGFWDLPMRASIAIRNDLYFAEPNNGKIHVFDDTYNDNGAAISFVYETKADDLGDPHQYGLMRYIDFQFKNTVGSVTSTFIAEDNSGTNSSQVTFNISATGYTTLFGWHYLQWIASPWHVGLLSASTQSLKLVRKRHPLRLRGQNIKLEIRNNTVNETLTLTRLDFVFVANNFRRYSHAHVV